MAKRNRPGSSGCGRPGRRLRRTLAAFLAIPALAVAASANIEQFYGNWENPARDASGLRYVRISPAGGNSVSLRVYGDCHPGLCDWGIATALPPAGIPAEKVTDLHADVPFGFASRKLKLSVAADGTLAFAVYYKYAKQIGKPPLYLRGRMRSTDWVGPVGKAVWETPESRYVGWGGGPYGKPLAPAQTRCTRFDPADARLTRDRGEWAATADGTSLFRTRWDRATARLALGTIRRYRFNAICRSGAVDFWMRDGEFAREAPAGASCIRFGATTAHLARIGKIWHVTDGTTDIYSFGRSRDNAFALLAMIRRHRLTRKCVLAWPDPVMVYWLSR